MAVPVAIEVGNESDGYDLMRALAVRGLTAELRSDRVPLEVTITLHHEPTELLLADLLPAIEQWRRDCGGAPIPVRVGTRRYAIAGDDAVALALREARKADSLAGAALA
jgi:hypothetical protein